MNSEFTKKLIYLIVIIEFINSIFGDTILYHINTIILILVGCTIRVKFEKWEIITIVIILLFTIQSTIKNDLTSFLKAISYSMFLIFFRRYSIFTNINHNKLLIFFFQFIVMPTFLLFCIIKIPIRIPEYLSNTGFTFYNRLIPNPTNDYTINIGPPNYTKHFTGTISLMCIFSTFLLYFNKRKKSSILLGIFYLYLLIFSGSRTAITILICCILLVYINSRKVKPWFSLLIFSFFVIQFYAIDFIIQPFIPFLQRNEYISILSKVANANNELGITSGRYFLWDYHLSLFLKSPFLGNNANLIRFKIGDLLPNGMIAIASSESYYTAMLAEFGLLGLFFPLLHLYFFYTALVKKNFALIIWLCIFILNNVYSSGFENIYTPLCRIMFMIILSTKTNPNRIKSTTSSIKYSSVISPKNIEPV